MKVLILSVLFLGCVTVEGVAEGPKYFRGLIPKPNPKKTPEEIQRLNKIYKSISLTSLPSSFDARDNGWVSSIKDQGQCGSCVAFATGGILEGCLAKAGVPIADADISEQQFLDCANMWSYGEQCRSGCDGQYGDQYLDFVKDEVENIFPEIDYPYLYNNGFSNNRPYCQNETNWNHGVIVNGYFDLYLGCTDDELMQLIYSYGSAMVLIYASDPEFENYESGVFTTCSKHCNDDYCTDHAVVAVGWGTEESSGEDYWLIKNSWSEYWGENGYIKVKRGTCSVGISGCFALSCSTK